MHPSCKTRLIDLIDLKSLEQKTVSVFPVNKNANKIVKSKPLFGRDLFSSWCRFNRLYVVGVTIKYKMFPFIVVYARSNSRERSFFRRFDRLLVMSSAGDLNVVCGLDLDRRNYSKNTNFFKDVKVLRNFIDKLIDTFQNRYPRIVEWI